jgi:CrcB protein
VTSELVLMIAGGGAIGSLLRYGIALAQIRLTAWPGWVGILLANLLGCLLMGLAAGVNPTSPWLRGLAMAGFCGGLTTFSAFALDLAFLCLTRAWRQAAACVGLSVVGGVGLVVLGLYTATWLSPTDRRSLYVPVPQGLRNGGVAQVLVGEGDKVTGGQWSCPL